MLIAVLVAALLVVSTSVMHYEALRLLHMRLPSIHVPTRAKLLVVILVAFVVHAAQIGLYGLAFHAMTAWPELGSLTGGGARTLSAALYFSAETYTSLGFGDVTPTGPVRLLAGVEALNGLLLIGWTASFTYISMERFWNSGRSAGPSR